MVGQTIEQSRSELVIGKDLRPLGERQIGREDGRAALVKLRQQIEQQLAAGALVEMNLRSTPCVGRS